MSIKVKMPVLNQLSCDFLNSTNGLSFNQRQQIQTIYPWKTGQITSYGTGDDGNLKYGRGTSFTGLTCNNPFGNNNRFTDTSGGQNYTNDLVLDWSSGLMWYRVPSTGATWNGAVDSSFSATTSGFTDWFLPNVKQLISIVNYETPQQNGLNYHPFNILVTGLASRIWTSTTCATNVTTAAIAYTESNNNTFGSTKTILSSYIYCRFFTLSDLGL